jgi:hypothetical protein
MIRGLMFSVFTIARGSVAIHDSCSEDSAIVANVAESSPIQVRHAVVGESLPCYAVSVGEVQGFILGNSLAVTREFERKRALESRVPIPVPPPVAADKKIPLAPAAPLFESWSGTDTTGRRIQIGATSKATLVTFWSVQSGAARRYVETLKKIEAEFRSKGLRSFGFIEAPSMARANYYLDDMNLDCPQALDRDRLAAKYKVDPAKGTTLVLNASSNVVAISSNPAEIRAAVTRLLSLE